MFSATRNPKMLRSYLSREMIGRVSPASGYVELPIRLIPGGLQAPGAVPPDLEAASRKILEQSHLSRGTAWSARGASAMREYLVLYYRLDRNQLNFPIGHANLKFVDVPGGLLGPHRMIWHCAICSLP